VVPHPPQISSKRKAPPAPASGVRLQLVGNITQEDSGPDHVILSGLVRNDGFEFARFVIVEVRTFKEDELLSTEDTYTDPVDIAPGWTVSFSMRIEKGWTSYQMMFHWMEGSDDRSMPVSVE
jgi:hypothetical protein